MEKTLINSAVLADGELFWPLGPRANPETEIWYEFSATGRRTDWTDMPENRFRWQSLNRRCPRDRHAPRPIGQPPRPDIAKTAAKSRIP